MISLGVFAVGAAVVLLVGPRMARAAALLADVTRLGGGLFGLVFLALATDLPEIALTPAAVLGGTPRLAVGSLLGSAAAQLALLAVVDVAFREGKLYKSAPVHSTLGQCALMLSVLAVPLVAAVDLPSIGPVHIATLLLPAVYLAVLVAIRRISDGGWGEPGVHATRGSSPAGAAALWTRFALFALALAGAGVALEWSSERIGSSAGLGATAAGALLAGTATSLPELVTAASAARSGALDLAVGDVVGSSALDVTLLSWAGAFYRDGSVLELLGPAELTLIGVTLALTALLVVGLARREPAGSERVGVESYLMLVVYAAGAVVLVSAGE